MFNRTTSSDLCNILLISYSSIFTCYVAYTIIKIICHKIHNNNPTYIGTNFVERILPFIKLFNMNYPSRKQWKSKNTIQLFRGYTDHQWYAPSNHWWARSWWSCDVDSTDFHRYTTSRCPQLLLVACVKCCSIEKRSCPAIYSSSMKIDSQLARSSSSISLIHWVVIAHQQSPDIHLSQHTHTYAHMHWGTIEISFHGSVNFHIEGLAHTCAHARVYIMKWWTGC